MHDTEHTILCADIGTSSLKAALIKSTGTVTAFSLQQFAPVRPEAAAGEWLKALCRAADEFSEKIGTACALCISGNGPTMVSESGLTLRWNTALPKKAADTPLSDRGTDSLFLPRILAFRQMFRDSWNSGGFLFSGPEYLIWQLTGNAVTILPEARYLKAYWNDEELKRNSIPDWKLPPFVPPAFNAGLTRDEITAALRLPRQLPVFCGAPDFIVALIGTGTLKNGMLCDCAGSSEGLNLCTDRPVKDNGIRTLPSVVPDLWNAAVLFPESGKLFSDYKIRMEQSAGRKLSYDTLIAESVSDRESDGFRLMQTLALNVKKGLTILLEAAEQNGIAVSPYMSATGGQAKNSLWLQMKADITGYPIAVTTCPDSELTGDAAFAWKGLGFYGSVLEAAASLVKITTVYEPHS